MPLRDNIPEIVSCSATAVAIALLLTQWPEVTPRQDPAAVLRRAAFVDEVVVDAERRLAAHDETKAPVAWVFQALETAGVYDNWRDRVADEEALLVRCLKTLEICRPGDAAEVSSLRYTRVGAQRLLGTIYAESGRAKEALPLQLAWVKYAEKEKDGRLGPPLARLAATYRELGQTEEALAVYRRAILQPDSVPFERRQWLWAYRNILTKLGKTTEEVRQQVKTEFSKAWPEVESETGTGMETGE